MKPDEFRALVLQAAIQGKLVPQDPKDEPASMLLERIRAETQKLMAEGKIKKSKSHSFIVKRDNHYYENTNGKEICIDDKIPFVIPENWTWSYGEGCMHEMENTVPDGQTFKYIDIDSIDNKKHIIKQYKTIDVSEAPSRARRKLHAGDTLFSMVRPYLENIAFVFEQNSDSIASTGFYVCKPKKCLIPRYLFLMMTSEYVVEGLNRHMRGDNSPSIKSKDIADYLYPIPPINEQKRIVSKIEELFSIVTEHENIVDITNKLVMQLRLPILNYAIRGKLVPQDPNDRPVNIDCKNPIIRRDNSYYENINGEEICIDNEIPFKIPDTWQWVRLGCISNYGRNKSVAAKNIPNEAYIIELENIEKDTGVIIGYTSRQTLIDSSMRHVFSKGDVLYSKLRPYLNKVVIPNHDGFCSGEIMALRFDSSVLPGYAQLFLMSPYFVEYAMSKAYGCKMPRLGTPDGKRALVAVPPTNEQKRIVEKIDSLINITNQLSC